MACKSAIFLSIDPCYFLHMKFLLSLMQSLSIFSTTSLSFINSPDHNIFLLLVSFFIYYNVSYN